MAAEIWTNTVPATAGTTAIPLAFWQLIQETIVVHKDLVVTSSGGTTVNLPAAFTAEIAAATEYGVQLTKESFDAGGGEIYVGSKTTASFKVMNSGSNYGESVFVTVFWIPA